MAKAALDDRFCYWHESVGIAAEARDWIEAVSSDFDRFNERKQDRGSCCFLKARVSMAHAAQMHAIRTAKWRAFVQGDTCAAYARSSRIAEGVDAQT
ncbi:hypothetical protein QCE47_14620 [Caballeronia sp. LZ025]|uniref:hypothetical protein n=1 Tax=Caballeronia TaxID=1827195 RepID=UPI001FD375F9|nr:MULTISPECIES: hypothetical protein [Caballeronia]MDR5733565.1 hypothetical protein [Caballeronia sp. LZ025]